MSLHYDAAAKKYLKFTFIVVVVFFSFHTDTHTSVLTFEPMAS